MKIHFLGTGAADWDIHHPTADRNFRRFSSILIDDCLLCDPGPCIFEFEQTFGYDNLLGGVKDIINTHRHSDHYDEGSVNRLAPIPFHTILAGEALETERHIIKAFAANHGTVEHPVHFVIESKGEGKRFFYGCDGAWLFYETYQALLGMTFDAMIFDCTIGDISGDYRIFEHNNIPMVREMAATFRSRCNTFVISHLARSLHTSHDETAAAMEKEGILTAYDNFVLML